jgi:hypothetical protein
MNTDEHGLKGGYLPAIFVFDGNFQFKGRCQNAEVALADRASHSTRAVWLQRNDGAHGVTRPTSQLLLATRSEKNFAATWNSFCEVSAFHRNTQNKFRAPSSVGVHPCSSVFLRG